MPIALSDHLAAVHRSEHAARDRAGVVEAVGVAHRLLALLVGGGGADLDLAARVLQDLALAVVAERSPGIEDHDLELLLARGTATRCLRNKLAPHVLGHETSLPNAGTPWPRRPVSRRRHRITVGCRQ
jgi:hypothetical protein